MRAEQVWPSIRARVCSRLRDAFQPGFFVATPHVLELMKDKIDEVMAAENTQYVKAKWITWSRRIGMKGSRARNDLGKKPWGWSVAFITVMRRTSPLGFVCAIPCSLR